MRVMYLYFAKVICDFLAFFYGKNQRESALCISFVVSIHYATLYRHFSLIVGGWTFVSNERFPILIIPNVWER